MGRQLHEFVRGHQVARRDVVGGRGRIAGLVAFGLIAGGFPPDHLAQPFRRLEVIHPDRPRMGAGLAV